jgi:hypothetical protein
MPGKGIIAALLYLLSEPAFAAPMTASEIRATLIGRELCTPRSGGLISELTFCFTYQPDGTFKFARADSGQAALWAFDKDQVCLFKASNPKEKSCASFERESDKRFTVNGKDHVCLGACED